MTPALSAFAANAARSVRLAWIPAFREALSDTAPIWGVLGVYLALAVATAYLLDVAFVARVVAFLPFVVGLVEVSLALGVVVVVGRIALVERSGRPLHRLWQELRRYAQPQIAARAALLIAAASALQVIYSFFKPQISRFGPYRWDAFFATADRMIFFGHHPWELLWPLLGHAPVIFALNLLYNFWFFWMLLVWVLVAFAQRHRAENTQYFLAYVLMWTIGGTLIATVFAAAGPCYYGNFVAGPNPFHELMARLFAINDRMPVFSLTVQAMLWQGQVHPDPTRLAGISALPSLHVTASVLRARIAFVHSRALGIASCVAAFAIFVASIVLGWHYALDGIVGTGVALGSWWLAGKILAWWRERNLARASDLELATP
jgi:hypothetical protein